MTIDIKTLSEKDLEQKIENIKAEREKTAEALKRYEAELEERRKQMPLGGDEQQRLVALVFG